MQINKVIHPLTQKDRNGKASIHVFCKITFDGKRLSITGVEGPKSNGDAKGSCGQIVDGMKGDAYTLAPGWTEETLARFVATWKRWHLNDMRPECEHQRALGWREIATREVTLYHWRLNSETQAMQRAIQDLVDTQVKALGEVKIGKGEQHVLALEYSAITHTPDPPAPEYAPAKRGIGPTEEKTLGWLKPEEHPDGIMCKPCPTCGYEYGSAWLVETVPEDVLAFLAGLPDSDLTPAWV